MKGYHVPEGYMGYVLGKGYVLFASEMDYIEYVLDELEKRGEE